MHHISCLLLMLSTIMAQDDAVAQVIGPDRIQDIYSCVGSSTYIPFPLNVMSRQGHEATTINLIFERRHSEKKIVIASYNGQHDMKVDNSFKDRISVSSENSGVFLSLTSMDDAGIYTAQARKANGQVWTRISNLTVLLRPYVHGGRLNISKSELAGRYGDRGRCVNVTCGMLEFAGYPQATVVWATPSKILSMKTATDYFYSSMVICAPYLGNITCSVAGFSSVCTYDLVASLYLDLPDSGNGTGFARSLMSQDLALTIIMPILSVLIPLAALGVWVLSHILKSHPPQYRDEQHYGQQASQVEIDIEENGTTEQTHDDDGHMEREHEQTEIPLEVQDSYDDDKEFDAVDSNHIHHHNHSGGGGDDGIDHDDEDEEKASEGRPLMQATIGTAV